MANTETIETNKGCCDDCGPLLVNAEISGAIRTLQHDSKEMMVIPVIAIVEGVLNGKLIPNEELTKFVTSWEGVPIPVQHPEINGQHVSANLPSILEKRVIGRFHNVRAENSKLKGEIWIDIAAAKAKGFEEILNTFNAGEMMEVSTAYFSDVESTSGTFNGKSYAGIYRNLRPDHLALLPGAIGACSIADGCGALRANKEDGLMSKIGEAFTALGLALGLTAHVEEIEAVEEITAQESADPAEAVAEDDQPTTGETLKTDEVQAMSEEAQVPQMDAETLTAVNWAREKYDAEKARLVARLTANKSCQFDEADLNGMHVNALEKLDSSLSPRDFSGRGLPVVNAQEVTEEVLEIPAFDGGAK